MIHRASERGMNHRGVDAGMFRVFLLAFHHDERIAVLPGDHFFGSTATQTCCSFSMVHSAIRLMASRIFNVDTPSAPGTNAHTPTAIVSTMPPAMPRPHLRAADHSN